MVVTLDALDRVVRHCIVGQSQVKGAQRVHGGVERRGMSRLGQGSLDRGSTVVDLPCTSGHRSIAWQPTGFHIDFSRVRARTRQRRHNISHEPHALFPSSYDLVFNLKLCRPSSAITSLVSAVHRRRLRHSLYVVTQPLVIGRHTLSLAQENKRDCTHYHERSNDNADGDTCLGSRRQPARDPGARDSRLGGVFAMSSGRHGRGRAARVGQLEVGRSDIEAGNLDGEVLDLDESLERAWSVPLTISQAKGWADAQYRHKHRMIVCGQAARPPDQTIETGILVGLSRCCRP